MRPISVPRANAHDEFVTPAFDGPSYCFSFLNSLIVPRPIAFITSMGQTGVINAAPFSYFNIVCTHPPMVSIAIERRQGERKDTSQNIINRKEFVINICSIDLAKAISIAGGDFPSDISEVELARLSLLPSNKVGAPRIANSLAQMECVLNRVVEVGHDPTDLILADVVVVHLHKDIINNDGRVSVEKLNPLARLAGSSFAKVGDFFDIPRGL